MGGPGSSRWGMALTRQTTEGLPRLGLGCRPHGSRTLAEVPILRARRHPLVEAPERLENLAWEEPRRFDRLVADVEASLERLAARPDR